MEVGGRGHYFGDRCSCELYGGNYRGMRQTPMPVYVDMSLLITALLLIKWSYEKLKRKKK